MSRQLYNMYSSAKRFIKEAVEDAASGEPPTEDFLKMIDYHNDLIEKLEIAVPHIVNQYKRDKAMQESFTREQQDFICWQIGEWYLEWKAKISSGLEPGQNRLGFAKEQLKTMICGE